MGLHHSFFVVRERVVLVVVNEIVQDTERALRGVRVRHMAQHGAQQRDPRAQVTTLIFLPRYHAEGIAALRVLSLFQGLVHSDRYAV